MAKRTRWILGVSLAIAGLFGPGVYEWIRLSMEQRQLDRQLPVSNSNAITIVGTLQKIGAIGPIGSTPLRIIRFGAEVGKRIDRYGSANVS